MKQIASFALSAMMIASAFQCEDDNSTVCDGCNLVPDAGPCEALVTKYYFDKDLNRCQSFTWGGCDGVVPFQTLEECRACCGHGEGLSRK
jgi:hypothetical protein